MHRSSGAARVPVDAEVRQVQVLPDSPLASALLLGDLARVASLPADALVLLVDRLGLRSAVLRGPDAALVAVAGEAVDAVPASRASAPAPGPVDVASEGVVLTVVGVQETSLPLLTAAVAVLALGLRAAGGPALLADADAERDALADALHDGPVQVLVAARYACDAALRGGDAGLARDAVQEAVVALRRTMWQLRPRTSSLPEALAALSDRLVEAGGAALALDVDAAADLPAPARALAYRLVQALALTGPLRVTAATAPDGVVLTLRGAPLPDPDRWGRRCRLLGASLVPGPDGLRLHLPAPPSETKACS